MICNVCATNNLSDASACAKCGGVLVARCALCAVEVPQHARFCPSCGRALLLSVADKRGRDDSINDRLSGERKQITILFGDFHGYTAFAAQLDPEDLRDTMDSIWASVDAIIAAHGGTPEKHSGDGVMAIFGGRRSREEDPAEAVRAALEMQSWLKSRNQDTHHPVLEMRIGINTGLVVIGPGEFTGEFLATGDAVNMASRLEQCAPAGGVLISRETYRHVFGFFDARTMPLLTVKGKSEPVETFRILRAKTRALASQMRGVQGVETEMIGRQGELKRLLDDFKFVLHKRVSRLTILIGDAGIGKSRLLFEFQKGAELFPEYFRLFFARATSELANRPFAMIRDLFCSRFEIQESDSAESAREKFENGISGLLGSNDLALARSGDEWLPDIHFLGQLLGFDFAASPHLRDVIEDTGQIRKRAFNGFIRLINTLSHRSASAAEPEISAVLLVLEDLHWCDDESLELLELLFRSSQDVPLMMLCSVRPTFLEGHTEWCHGPVTVNRLNLDSLSASESDCLVGNILNRVREIPTALLQLVTEVAEGNPFYIEEMIKMLMDQGVIIPQADPWRIELGRLAGTRVPSTLTGVLQARLDGLSMGERRVLQCASVVGRVFWAAAIEHMGLPPEPRTTANSAGDGTHIFRQIPRVFEVLHRKGLIFQREPSAFASSTEYTFKHELLRNVAYESLLKKSRRHYHALFAEWLEAQAGGRVLEFAPILASHFELARRPAEAAEWHGRAGHHARLGYSPSSAIMHFRRALELMPSDASNEDDLRKKQIEWHEGLVETLGAQARFSEALAASNIVRRLAREILDPVAEARAWNDMAFLHERRGDNRASVECSEQAEARALEAAEAGKAERVRALLLKGWAFYRLSEVSAVLELGRKLITLCNEINDRRGTASSFKLLGVAHLQLGDCGAATRFFQDGLVVFEQLGDQRNIAAMWSNLGETARATGDFKMAVGYYEKALTIAKQIGHSESELVYRNNLSGARVGLLQFEEAAADLWQVISQTTAPNSCTLAETFTFLSEAILGQGKFFDALIPAQKAVKLALESESPLHLGGAWRTLGKIGAAMSKHRGRADNTGLVAEMAVNEPAHCFAESLRVFRQISAAGEQARTWRAWAEHEFQQGKMESAREKLREAHDIFLRLDMPLELAATDAILQAQSDDDCSATSIG